MLNALSLKLPSPLSAFKQKAVVGLIALSALATLTSLSCGKRKPPLPPIERVLQKIEVVGFQRGPQVVLSWKMPVRNAPAGSSLNINRADIYRLAEPLNSPLTLTEEEFSSRSIIIASLKVEDGDFGLKTMSFTDDLEFAGQPVRLRYAVRLVNPAGQKAGYSNFLLIEPASNVAANPSFLSGQPAQTAILLTWTPPTANVNGTQPVNLLGYNIYRSGSEKETAKLLNPTPISDAKYSDLLFEFDKDYFYFVRAVSVGGEGTPTESLESNIFKIHPKDVFAPTPPDAVTAAATLTTISLFWPSNPENDIAGYRIYRSTDRDLGMSQWTLLTGDLLSKNTYQDGQVESGKTYYYYLTATDTRGNVSQPSEIVSETIP